MTSTTQANVHRERVSRRSVRLPRLSLLSGIAVIAIGAALVFVTGNVRAFDPVPVPPPNVPPRITGFVGGEGILEWTFEGRVIDENPIGLRVEFGGILAGHHTIVRDSEGYFDYALPLNTSGEATAQTVDDNQQHSNVARFRIF